jgi:hypothetical protein
VAEPPAPAAAPAARPTPIHRAAPKAHPEDRSATPSGTKGAAAPLASRHPRPGHAAKPAASGARPATAEAKPAAHGDAKPHTAAATEAAAILSHPAPAHHAAAEGATKPHPRPHAPKGPAGAKPEAQKATASPQKAAKSE